MRFIIRFPSLREDSRGMLRATVLSVLLHVGAAGAVLVALGFQQSAPLPLPVYIVSLVDFPPEPAAAGPIAPSRPAPAPKKKVVAPPEEVPAETPPKKKRKKPRPEPEKQPEPKPVQAEPETGPDRDPPQSETEIDPSHSTEPTGSGLATSADGGPGGLPTIDSDAFQFGYYRNILTNRLRATWSQPLVPGGLDQPIRSTVRFVILRSGALTEVEIIESSGYPPLDRSALRSVFDANPLPPLPEPYDGDQLAVNFFFELTPER